MIITDKYNQIIEMIIGTNMIFQGLTCMQVPQERTDVKFISEGNEKKKECSFARKQKKNKKRNKSGKNQKEISQKQMLMKKEKMKVNNEKDKIFVFIYSYI